MLSRFESDSSAELDTLEREYATGRSQAGFFELSDRALLAVTGPLRQKFLNSILSNEIASLASGQGCRAALMDARGHQLAWMRVLVTSDLVLLELPASRGEVVETQLIYYRVATPVRFAKQEHAILGIVGPRAADVLRGFGAEMDELTPEAHVLVAADDSNVRISRAGDLPLDGYVLYAPPETMNTLISRLGAAGAIGIGRPTLDALRIEEGLPWYGPDVTEANLLHETGLVREYHSPTKGCYVGQEVVARLEARGGHVNKGLRGLRLQSPARAGDLVTAEGREAGQITTAAVSPRLGPIAMAYVHRSRFEPGTTVEVNGAPATVTALPMQEG